MIDKWLKENGDPKIERLVKLEAYCMSSVAYKDICKVYKDNTTRRTGVPLINHIDEGLKVLIYLGADKETMDAYCLHPIFQGDQELKKIYDAFPEGNVKVNVRSVVLAMEYRSTANAYLSTREIETIEDFQLNPLDEVNLMLVADKVQNYKDFVKYHKGTHPRSHELDLYFRNWFIKLGVTTKRYEELLKICTE